MGHYNIVVMDHERVSVFDILYLVSHVEYKIGKKPSDTLVLSKEGYDELMKGDCTADFILVNNRFHFIEGWGDSRVQDIRVRFPEAKIVSFFSKCKESLYDRVLERSSYDHDMKALGDEIIKKMKPPD